MSDLIPFPGLTRPQIIALIGANAAPIDHDHDLVYAAILHNHDDRYALIDHNHDLVYAALVHTHSGYQASDGDLDALAALTGTGFAKRTGADTWSVGSLASGDIPSHSHAAGDTTSGVFDAARIPSLDYAAVGHTHSAITLADGSTATPSVNFTNGANWGLYLNSGGASMNIVVAGVVLMYLTAGGMLTAGTGMFSIADALTNAPLNVMTLRHNSSGTPAAGFGSAMRFQMGSDTTPSRDAGRIRSEWTNAADASRTSKIVLSVINATSEVDVFTLTPTGINATAIGATTQSTGSFSTGTFGTGGLINISTFLDFSNAAGGATMLRTKQTGDADFRILWTFDGAMTLGSGASGGRDTQFARQNNAGYTGGFGVHTPTALTNTVKPALFIRHTTTGTAAAGLGTSIIFLLEGASGTIDRTAAEVKALWNNAAEATSIGDLILSAYYGISGAFGEREGIRIRGASGAAQLGFFGAAPVSKPAVTGSRGGNAALASLLTQLASLGLLTDSSTA